MKRRLNLFPASFRAERMMKEATQLQQCREISESRAKGITMRSLSYGINNTLIDDSGILSPSSKEGSHQISLTHSDESSKTALSTRSFSKIPRKFPRTLSCPTYGNISCTEREKN